MASTAPGAAGNRRQGGAMHSPWTWVILLGIAVAGGAYILYRRRASAAANTTSTPTTSTPAGTPNPDWSGEISTLQTEIMDLQSSEAQAQAADQKEDRDDDDDHDKDDRKPKSNTVTVPNVVGQSQEDATDNLADAGLRGVGQTPVHGKVRIVTAQSPRAGAKVKKGTVVHLTTKLTPASKHHGRPSPPGKGVRPGGSGGPVKTHAHHVHRKAA